MGNITNLATTGNYATEANGLKVSFNFRIDNEKKQLKTFDGTVTEKKDTVNEMGETVNTDVRVATFHKNEYPEVRDGINMILTKGREAELATAIAEAVASLEANIAEDTVTADIVAE